MTLREAVRLVMESTFLARGGEVFVTKMPVVRIEDLAQVMVRELAPQHGHDPLTVKIEVIGSKPGEKLYEELMNDEETRRTLELPDYFVVLPAFQSLYETIEYDYPNLVAETIDHPYNSARRAPMAKPELRSYLIQHQLLEEGEVTCVS
jgi:FlaA1/EpsC-like NDP-sugar epimerase